MTEEKLFGKLLPANLEFQSILSIIREKFDLPEIEYDDGLSELILSDKNYDWGEIKVEIENQLLSHPELFGDVKVIKLLQEIEKTQGKLPALEGFENLPEITLEWIQDLYSGLFGLLQPSVTEIQGISEHMATAIFEFLLTGETREVPEEWLGRVFVAQNANAPMVIAVAGSIADPKKIAQEFTAMHRKIFGKENRSISKGSLNSAEYLRMKLAGKPLKDIADVYIERNPSEIMSKPGTKEYRETKGKIEDKLKKRMQRLQTVVNALGGDKIE